jgi:glycosyltransferase involved in cell wall biosynthesis
MLSVVIPAHNEASRLGTTLNDLTDLLRRQAWDWEVRVVDDGSTDGTAGVADEHGRSEPRVVLQREPHRGKGGAVKAGMLAARGAYRFLCDADLSMPARELPRFLPPRLVDFDLAIGTREGFGARRVGEPLRRHVLGRVFNHLVQRLVLDGTNDTQCGFKMFTARAADAVFPLVTIDGWAFDVEVLAIARRRGFRVVEVPIEWHYRPESQVSMLSDGWRMVRDLRKIRARVASGKYDHTPASLGVE